MQKRLGDFRRVQTQQGTTVGAEQVGQAAQQTRPVFGGHKTAFLKARWVGDDQVVRAHAGDLAPRAEEVVAEEFRALGDAVELVVLLACGQRGVGHVDVDHRACAAEQGRDRERTGVGEQVEHLRTLGVGTQPATAFGHVQKQPVVLAAQQVHAVLRAVFAHHVRLGDIAREHHRLAAAGLARLQHRAQRRVGCELLLTRLERLGEHGLFFGRDLTEFGEQPHRRVPVEQPVFAAGKSATASMKQALGIAAGRGVGNGVDQGLHGWGGAHATKGGRPWRRRACAHASLPSSNSRQGLGRHS